MHVDYGYFEGDHLGKPYDIKLIRRLLTYAKPYRLIIGLSIMLMLFVTGFELLFPYLIKVAIDDYIVVSHRLSSIKEADKIIVLDDGEIKEMGDHASLLSIGGVYAEIYRRQQIEEELDRENRRVSIHAR